MVESKNLKLKLGLCGLALTSFLALNSRSVVHADTVSGSNAGAITWDSDQDDSQVVKEDSNQKEPTQNAQGQAPATQSVQSNVQKRAEMSAVRVSNFDSRAVNQVRVNNARPQAKVANVNATVKDAPVQVTNPQNNQVIVHFVKSNGQSINDPNVKDQMIDVTKSGTFNYNVPVGYTLSNPNYATSETKHDIKYTNMITAQEYANIDNLSEDRLAGITYYIEPKSMDLLDVPDGVLTDQVTKGKPVYMTGRKLLDIGASTVNDLRQACKKCYEGTYYEKSLTQDQYRALDGVYFKFSPYSTGADDYLDYSIPNEAKYDYTKTVHDAYVFQDNSGQVKLVVGNHVNIAVTKPQNVDPNSAQCKKQATRVIHIAFPNGVKPDSYDSITDSAGNKLALDSNNNLTQTVTFTRTKTVDSLTGATLTQTPWQQHGAINAVTLPDIPGYTMTQTK